MSQIDNIETIEKQLWSTADMLRANSNYASNEYFMPVMGLVFLRHAYSRYLSVKDNIEASLPKRGGVKRSLTKEDFSKKSSIFLQPKAQFDYLISLKDSDDRAKAIIDAMVSIETDYETLRGVLPKQEYRELDNEMLGQLFRTLNPDELKKISGDVFGKIYEYFLTQFANQKAHDGGEFFTPVSLVSLIANILEPKRGTVLDPACGSGGMFVQSARFVETLNNNPNDQLAFYGLEKNATTINLAKMNLAVHGLVGDIKKAITYYEDPHNLDKKVDFVMANPPFNVDEIDAEKIKNDSRLPFGLPGVNKKGKVSNGNYIWISYFYSYLNDKGRCGFVMSSQASSAGKSEKKVRQRLIETGHVDIMISIRSNFFYTRTVPSELWFLNKAKTAGNKDKVLMIDARNIFRKVTKKIYDFSPEQLQNILSIVWLYRGETKRFHNLVIDYISKALKESLISIPLAKNYEKEFDNLNKQVEIFTATLLKNEKSINITRELQVCINSYKKNSKIFFDLINQKQVWWKSQNREKINLVNAIIELNQFAEKNNTLIKETELMFRIMNRLIDECLEVYKAKENVEWKKNKIIDLKKQTKDTCDIAVNQLKISRYFQYQAQWLVDRFPEETLRDVEGLVKVVDRKMLKENDWSLTPGRYVGVALEEEDPDFDFNEAIMTIHSQISSLNEESTELIKKIMKNLNNINA
jgi:type I restriction enzyme M protein